MKLRTAAVCGLLALALSAPSLQASGRRHQRRALYEVTVTNVTKGQAFTPFLVVAHSPHVSLFHLGHPAGEELEALAEEGNTVPFQEALKHTGGVHGLATGDDLLAPGQTVKIKVWGHRNDRISLAGMLIPTNDGFVALNGAGPFDRWGQSTLVPGYDAGTEVNDEACASIPGPFYEECGGEGGGGAPSGGEEGYVRIHEGINGVGDFEPEDRDWRNPVAYISVRRLY